VVGIITQSGSNSAVFKLIWLIPAIPLAGAAVNLFWGKKFGKSAGLLGSATVGVSFVLTAAVLLQLLTVPASNRLVFQHLFDWITVGSFKVGADLRVDTLSITMMMVVTGVGFVIHVYSNGYMEGDPKLGRFFAYMNLFVFFMLLLVMSDNLLLLYVGWEGVGLCSYLLIGFWSDRPAAANAAKKAFITTRIGDTAFLVGIALYAAHYGNVLTMPLATAGSGSAVSSVTAGGFANAIALLLFAGAVGKSAQFPLHVWLPDAMEGPTPVSALIHAATMVTAGVYLMVRMHVFLDASRAASDVVLIIGLFTAIYAGTAALGQDDIKRVLAYSTISQLGFMFVAIGMHAYALAMLLLVTHAFYKALMFLSAGSVIHGLRGEQDMKKMGGLARAMPVTFAVFAIGAAALAGIPPLAGFFSKDHIVSFASTSGRPWVYVFLTSGALFSAFYIARLIFMTFLGDQRSDAHAHESPPIMTVPLLILAAGAAGGGILGISADNGVLSRFLIPVAGRLTLGTAGLPEAVLTLISVVIAVGAVVVAFLVYGSGKVDWLALRVRLAPLQRTLAHAWYVDDIYAAMVAAPGKAFAAFTAYVVDLRVIDGIVNGAGAVVQGLASTTRRVQTGLVRTYALAIFVGAVALLIYVGFRL
jgi:NADH-quinone oxidoreductase subunit L